MLSDSVNLLKEIFCNLNAVDENQYFNEINENESGYENYDTIIPKSDIENQVKDFVFNITDELKIIQTICGNFNDLITTLYEETVNEFSKQQPMTIKKQGHNRQIRKRAILPAKSNLFIINKNTSSNNNNEYGKSRKMFNTCQSLTDKETQNQLNDMELKINEEELLALNDPKYKVRYPKQKTLTKLFDDAKRVNLDNLCSEFQEYSFAPNFDSFDIFNAKTTYQTLCAEDENTNKEIKVKRKMITLTQTYPPYPNRWRDRSKPFQVIKNQHYYDFMNRKRRNLMKKREIKEEPIVNNISKISNIINFESENVTSEDPINLNYSSTNVVYNEPGNITKVEDLTLKEEFNNITDDQANNITTKNTALSVKNVDTGVIFDTNSKNESSKHNVFLRPYNETYAFYLCRNYERNVKSEHGFCVMGILGKAKKYIPGEILRNLLEMLKNYHSFEFRRYIFERSPYEIFMELAGFYRSYKTQMKEREKNFFKNILFTKKYIVNEIENVKNDLFMMLPFNELRKLGKYYYVWRQKHDDWDFTEYKDDTCYGPLEFTTKKDFFLNEQEKEVVEANLKYFYENYKKITKKLDELPKEVKENPEGVVNSPLENSDKIDKVDKPKDSNLSKNQVEVTNELNNMHLIKTSTLKKNGFVSIPCEKKEKLPITTTLRTVNENERLLNSSKPLKVATKNLFRVIEYPNVLSKNEICGSYADKTEFTEKTVNLEKAEKVDIIKDKHDINTKESNSYDKKLLFKFDDACSEALNYNSNLYIYIPFNGQKKIFTITKNSAKLEMKKTLVKQS